MANTPSSLSTFWEAYGDSSQLVEIETRGPSGSLAAHVLETFNIPMDTSSSSVGGNLEGLDIKQMDAMAVINLSLLEELAESGSFSGSGLYEPIVTPEGEVKFVEIGGDVASLSDIYYQVQSAAYVEQCTGVLVRGGKILPEWKDTSWLPIWGNGASRLVFDTTRMLANCTKTGFSTHATIVFNDPNLDSAYDDGINNLYELSDPYERIMGYAHWRNAPGMTADTRITWSNTAVVPILVDDGGGPNGPGPEMGNLIPKPPMNSEIVTYGEGCWTNSADSQTSASYSDGIEIPLDASLRFESVRGTKVDKFQKVEEILIVARELTMVKSAPLNDSKAASSQTPSDSNNVAIISIDDSVDKVFKLEEGKDYIISYKEEEGFKKPYIVFGKDGRIDEPKDYGSNTDYVISQSCLAGYYSEGEEGKATIFPVAQNRGYMVKEIWAMVSIDTPSIVIYDPEDNGFGQDGASSKAKDIADAFEYFIKPLVVYEPPPLIAYNGRRVDQTDGAPDNDPTTVQDFEDTELEEIYDELSEGGGGLEITLPFFNSEDDIGKLETLSASLHDYMNGGDGVETTYVCGPNTQVELGQSINNGVVNSITYSYTDSGSYTISVNEGPRIIKPFSGGGPAGPSMKASETFNARATVIKSLGNGIHYKLRIDGFGERIAINMSHEIIREGDIVSCSVHNNPVEA